MLADAYLTVSDNVKALAVAKEAYALAPDNAAVLGVLSNAEFANDQPDLALETTEKRIAPIRDTASGMVQLGVAQLRAGKPDAARASYEQSLKTTANYLPALLALADLDMRQKDIAGASKLADQIVEKYPEAAAGYALRGDLAAAGKTFAKAADYYQQALTKSPSSELAVKRHNALVLAGERARAYELTEKWIDAHPDDAAAKLTLAGGYQHDGRNDDAIRLYEQVLKLSPDNGVALNNLAWLYGEKGDRRAVDLAEKAYAKYPDTSATADTLGWILTRSGDVERGLKLLRKAVNLAPTSADTRYHLAVALSKSGDKQKALEEVTRALETNTFDARDAAIKLQSELK